MNPPAQAGSVFPASQASLCPHLLLASATLPYTTSIPRSSNPLGPQPPRSYIPGPPLGRGHCPTSFLFPLEFLPPSWALPSICLPPYPTPHPSLSAPPSSQLTEHTEQGSSALVTIRERGELAGVISFIFHAQLPHNQRGVPQLLTGLGGHEFQPVGLVEAGALGGVEDRHAAGELCLSLFCPGHLCHRHIVFQGV